MNLEDGITSQQVNGFERIDLFTYGTETVDDTVKTSKAVVASVARGKNPLSSKNQTSPASNSFHTQELLGIPASVPIHVHGNQYYRVSDAFDEMATQPHITRESKV